MEKAKFVCPFDNLPCYRDVFKTINPCPTARKTNINDFDTETILKCPEMKEKDIGVFNGYIIHLKLQ